MNILDPGASRTLAPGILDTYRSLLSYDPSAAESYLSFQKKVWITGDIKPSRAYGKSLPKSRTQPIPNQIDRSDPAESVQPVSLPVCEAPPELEIEQDQIQPIPNQIDWSDPAESVRHVSLSVRKAPLSLEIKHAILETLDAEMEPMSAKALRNLIRDESRLIFHPAQFKKVCEWLAEEGVLRRSGTENLYQLTRPEEKKFEIGNYVCAFSGKPSECYGTIEAFSPHPQRPSELYPLVKFEKNGVVAFLSNDLLNHAFKYIEPRSVQVQIVPEEQRMQMLIQTDYGVVKKVVGPHAVTTYKWLAIAVNQGGLICQEAFSTKAEVLAIRQLGWFRSSPDFTVHTYQLVA